MWVYTRYGFFSVVSTELPNGKASPHEVQIRARCKKHLENVRKRFSHLWEKTPRIIHTPIADYAYRMIVPQDLAAGMFMELVQEIQYTNFKEECHKTMKDASYHGLLHVTWSAAHQYQVKNESMWK